MTTSPLVSLFDQYADTYAAHTTQAERWARETGLALLEINSEQQVFELGCGIGEDLAVIASKAGETRAVDAAPNMVQMARERLDDAGLKAQVSTSLAPPLAGADDSCDAVWCSLTLELQSLSDAALIAQEIHRLLRSGGRWGIVAQACWWPDHGEIDWASPSWQGAFQAADHDAVHWKTFLKDMGFRIGASQRVSLGNLDADILVAEPAGAPEVFQDIGRLVTELQSRQAVARIVARQRLALLGETAVEPLCRLAHANNERCRVEAVKCLFWLGEPSSIASLVERLEDSSQQVRWLAAKALIKLGRSEPVVERLTHPSSNSFRLYGSAGQVLRALHRRGETRLRPLVDAFEDGHPETSVPVIARQLRA